MAVEYTKSFRSKTFQNIPKVFFGMQIYHLATLVVGSLVENSLIVYLMPCFKNGSIF
jgi:hypothetical protein